MSTLRRRGARLHPIPDAAAVDLSLVKLPEAALIFPSTAGEMLDLTRLRDPHAVSREFRRQVRARGFAKLRFHDLRGSHETAPLDAGVPAHVVAARCGHDPAVLLRSYAKKKGKADTDAASAIGALLGGALARRTTRPIWDQLGTKPRAVPPPFARACQQAIGFAGRSGRTRTPSPQFWRLRLSLPSRVGR